MHRDWPVTKNQKSCASCSAEFETNGVFFSALREQNGQFVREDFCSSCWENARQIPFFSFWKTRLRDGKEKEKVNVDVVLEFFERLQNPSTDRDRTFRYLLSLFLWRRRALKLVDVVRNNGRETMLFRRGAGESPIAVENPRLDEEQVASATEQLRELLQMEI